MHSPVFSHLHRCPYRPTALLSAFYFSNNKLLPFSDGQERSLGGHLLRVLLSRSLSYHNPPRAINIAVLFSSTFPGYVAFVARCLQSVFTILHIYGQLRNYVSTILHCFSCALLQLFFHSHPPSSSHFVTTT